MSIRKIEYADELFSKLGKQIKPDIGFMEFIHNSDDSKSKNIFILTNNNEKSIIIKDDGEGMSYDDLENLRIGKSNKEQKIGEYGLGICLYCKEFVESYDIISINKNKLINYKLYYKNNGLFIENPINCSIKFDNTTYNFFINLDKTPIQEELKIYKNGYSIKIKYKDEKNYNKVIKFLNSIEFQYRIPSNIKIYIDDEEILKKDFLNKEEISKKNIKKQENNDFIITMTNDEKNEEIHNRLIEIKKNNKVLTYVTVSKNLIHYKTCGLQQKTGNANPNFRVSINILKNYNNYIITNEDKEKLQFTEVMDNIICKFLQTHLEQYKKTKKEIEINLEDFNRLNLEDKILNLDKNSKTNNKEIMKKLGYKPDVTSLFIEILKLQEKLKEKNDIVL